LGWAVDPLTPHGAMVILSLLDLAAGWILQGHAALQATVTAAAETGQHLDAVQRRHPASWYPSLIEGLASLHTAVDIHPHGWQRVQVEAAQTVPSGVVAKSALGADPVWEMRVSQFTVPLLQAGQAKHKAMETARKMLDGAISGSVRVYLTNAIGPISVSPL